MMKHENMVKNHENKGMQSITRLLLLAACTNSQENRFDIPQSKSYRAKRPRHTQKVNA